MVSPATKKIKRAYEDSNPGLAVTYKHFCSHLKSSAFWCPKNPFEIFMISLLVLAEAARAIHYTIGP